MLWSTEFKVSNSVCSLAFSAAFSRVEQIVDLKECLKNPWLDIKDQKCGHTYPLDFLYYMTLHMTVVYNMNYLSEGFRIWFWPNCQIWVVGYMANFSSEIG